MRAHLSVRRQGVCDPDGEQGGGKGGFKGYHSLT